MTRRIHVAVIDTDVPVSAVYASRGLYSSQFRVLLQAAAARLNWNQNHTKTFNEPVAIHTTSYDAIGDSLPPLQCLRTHPYRPKENEENAEEQNEINNYGPPGPIDAILITGSSASAYAVDTYPWIPGLESFIHTVYTDYPHVKIFGSCFGHQVIAKALLEEPQQQISKHEKTTRTKTSERSQSDRYLKVESCPYGYEIGIHPISLNSAFTAHFSRYFPELSEKDSFRIQLIHGDRVVPISFHNREENASSPPSLQSLLPTPWLNLGTTPLSPIQGLYNPKRVLTYQGHFEFDRFVNRETCCEFARRGGWSGSFVETALECIMGRHHGDEGNRKDEEDIDEDDAKLAAEMVVVFFAGEDGTDSSIITTNIDDIINTTSTVRMNGMITPPSTC